ncbi:MAG: hypothetical protein SRB2_03360 [Desulfobacteraceae bacterium Eth-SRB2]|nr:MAG: hypothetical protein SRB2_03360 [Desulfobacteraceae bacterium Eth-SRB2]
MKLPAAPLSGISAPLDKLRGIKVELRRSHSNVKDIAEFTRLRSDDLRRDSPCLSSLQPRWAGSPLCYDKLQGITAKANKCPYLR